MSTKELDEPITDDSLTEEDVSGATDTETDDEDPALDLEVSIIAPSACERHVTVTISREDIDRYFDDAFSEMMPSAAVPGFRAGRAPRKLVEQRFRKEIADQIKGSLLVDSLEQISEDHELTAISEPDFNLEAVEVPNEGPMTFEFDIEVRPEFDLPDWSGIRVKRPVCEYTDEDVDYQLEKILDRFSQLIPFDGAASPGDFLTLHVICMHEGRQTAAAEEIVVRLQPTLSFRDAKLADFDKLMEGVKEGDRRETEISISQDSPNEALRGETITVELEVLEVKKLRLPELTEEFLHEMGEYDSEADMRDAIRDDLDRQTGYEQSKRIRQQITGQLTEAAKWDLPPSMLERQSARELDRAVMELRRSGFSEADIRAHENELRQNSAASTAAALKEHFILERIAEEEEIDVEEADYEVEIGLLASQSGESNRRVRAQLEKRGLMDVLRNQIVERKVLALIESKAKFQDSPFTMPRQNVEAIDFAAGGRGIATETQEAGSDDESE